MATFPNIPFEKDFCFSVHLRKSCLDIRVVLVVGEEVESAALVDPEVGVLVRGAAVLVAARLLAPVAPTVYRLLRHEGPWEGLTSYFSDSRIL